MISVVVPVFNVSDYLKESLMSLIAQSDILPEIILVNDGSTDNSLSICKEFKDHYSGLAKIVDKKNGGLSDARNAGMEEVTGEWTVFLDSDDWLATDALERLLDFAVSYDCDMVSGGFYYSYKDYLLFDDRWLKDSIPLVLTRKEAMKALIQQRYLKNFAWGKLYKTEIVKNHLFRKGVFYEDSYWQHYIIDECNRIGVVPEPLYFYRQRDDSISGSFSERNLDLLRGNEERLQFIIRNYPELKHEMASSFWRMSYNFKRYAESYGKDDLIRMYSSFYSSVEERYRELFHDSLSGDIQYVLRNNRSMSSVYYFSKRVTDYLFSKRLKKKIKNEE